MNSANLFSPTDTITLQIAQALGHVTHPDDIIEVDVIPTYKHVHAALKKICHLSSFKTEQQDTIVKKHLTVLQDIGSTIVDKHDVRCGFTAVLVAKKVPPIDFRPDPFTTALKHNEYDALAEAFGLDAYEGDGQQWARTLATFAARKDDAGLGLFIRTQAENYLERCFGEQL